MRRLLYLAYSFPPAPMIGSVRSWNTAAQLRRLGWDVTVVTPRPGLWARTERGTEVQAEIERLGIRLLTTEHAWPMLVPGELRRPSGGLGRLAGAVLRKAARRAGIDPYTGWVQSVRRRCASLHRGDYDVVLATGNPFPAFASARQLSKRLECPYVLDYRDPWTGNPHAQSTMPWNERQERRLILGAKAVTVVSPSWAQLIGDRFGVAAKVHVVSNGYDGDVSHQVAPRRYEHFAVVYAGVLYPPKRTLDTVLLAFREFARRRPPGSCKFHYLGASSSELAKSVRAADVADLVVDHGPVSRAEALSAVAGAGLVVVVASIQECGSPPTNGIVTGKIFDCLAYRRPYLAVAPPGSDLRAVVHVAGGGHCCTGSDTAAMTALMHCVAEGAPPPWSDPAQFEWTNIAVALDRVLTTVAETAWA